jgi:hypothetical protein
MGLKSLDNPVNDSKVHQETSRKEPNHGTLNFRDQRKESQQADRPAEVPKLRQQSSKQTA